MIQSTVRPHLKKCALCKTPKVEGEFYLDASKYDGLTSTCRSCQRKQYYDHETRRLRRNVYTAMKMGRFEGDVDDVIQMYKNNPACYYCYKELDQKEASIEHKTPISRGGSKTIDNIAISCFDCNRLKHTKTESEFREFLLEYRDRLNKL